MEVEIDELFFSSEIALEDRSAATLLPIIKNYKRQDSKIYSNEWKAYQQLTDLGFEYDIVCHKYNLIDSETGSHTHSRDWVDLVCGKDEEQSSMQHPPRHAWLVFMQIYVALTQPG